MYFLLTCISKVELQSKKKPFGNHSVLIVLLSQMFLLGIFLFVAEVADRP
jgi:hypothetical protein